MSGLRIKSRTAERKVEYLSIKEGIDILYEFYTNTLQNIMCGVSQSPQGVIYYVDIEMAEFTENHEEWFFENFFSDISDQAKEMMLTREQIGKLEWMSYAIFPYLQGVTGETTTSRLVSEATKVGMLDNMGINVVNDWLDEDEFISKEQASQILKNVEEIFEQAPEITDIL